MTISVTIGYLLVLLFYKIHINIFYRALTVTAYFDFQVIRMQMIFIKNLINTTYICFS